MCAQAFERRNDIFLVHIHRVGDHTRGLFEAEASPVVSATHTLQDVEVFFFVSHLDLPNSKRILGWHAGKTNLLCGDQFCRCFRRAVRVHDYAEPNKNPPLVSQPR
jgi:hypothetical protein